jgi:hypothetical protein
MTHDIWNPKTRNEAKNFMVFNKPTYTLMNNKNTGIKLIAEMDLFNNHIEFLICDEAEEIFYNSSFGICEAVDLFFDEVDRKKSACHSF